MLRTTFIHSNGPLYKSAAAAVGAQAGPRLSSAPCQITKQIRTHDFYCRNNFIGSVLFRAMRRNSSTPTRPDHTVSLSKNVNCVSFNSSYLLRVFDQSAEHEGKTWMEFGFWCIQD